MFWVLILGMCLGIGLDFLAFQRYNDLERQRLRRENQRLHWLSMAKDAELTEVRNKDRLRNTRATPAQGPRTWEVPTQPTWPPLDN